MELKNSKSEWTGPPDNSKETCSTSRRRFRFKNRALNAGRNRDDGKRGRFSKKRWKVKTVSVSWIPSVSISVRGGTFVGSDQRRGERKKKKRSFENRSRVAIHFLEKWNLEWSSLMLRTERFQGSWSRRR